MCLLALIQRSNACAQPGLLQLALGLPAIAARPSPLLRLRFIRTCLQAGRQAAAVNMLVQAAKEGHAVPHGAAPCQPCRCLPARSGL